MKNHKRKDRFIIAFLILFPFCHSTSSSAQNWWFDKPVREILAKPDYSLSVSGDKIFIQKDEKLWVTHSFGKPIVSIVPNPNYPVIAVYLSNKEKLLEWEQLSTKYNKAGYGPWPLNSTVDSLYFYNMDNKSAILIADSDSLAFSDWYFEVWSPTGKYAALLLSRYGGPIDVIQVEKFLKTGKLKPIARIVQELKGINIDEIVELAKLKGIKYDSIDDLMSKGISYTKKDLDAIGHYEPGKIFSVRGWQSDNILKYEASCCGYYEIFLFNVTNKKRNRIKRGDIRNR